MLQYSKKIGAIFRISHDTSKKLDDLAESLLASSITEEDTKNFESLVKIYCDTREEESKIFSNYLLKKDDKAAEKLDDIYKKYEYIQEKTQSIKKNLNIKPSQRGYHGYTPSM